MVVGAGPAGLAAAIRLKQSAPDLSVVVVEKGSEVGAHILLGAVIDPSGLDALLPGWRDEDTPVKTAVQDDRFYMLGAAGALRLPNILMPPLMSNHGNFIVSLGDVCRWLAVKAEAAGVEITRARRRRKCCSARTARLPASPPATWGRDATASRSRRYARHGVAGQIHVVRRRGSRGQPPRH